jgi:hypothetical protein
MLDLRRRQFLTLLGGAAAAWPLVAGAQQGDVRRVGVLMSVAVDGPDGQPRLEHSSASRNWAGLTARMCESTCAGALGRPSASQLRSRGL